MALRCGLLMVAAYVALCVLLYLDASVWMRVRRRRRYALSGAPWWSFLLLGGFAWWLLDHRLRARQDRDLGGDL